MKKCILIFLGAALLLPAQEVVKNSARPLHDNPGRVLTPQSVLKIPGEGEGYYHNGAKNIQFDTDGFIYLNDSWASSRRAHLLRFDRDGRFVADLYRHGEGPGEIQSLYHFVLYGENIYAYDLMKRKLVVMDLDGRFLDEIPMKSDGSLNLIGLFGDKIIFGRQVFPSDRKTSKLYDVGNDILLYSRSGDKIREFSVLKHRQFFISLAKGGGGKSWDPFIAVPAGGCLFICRSREYRIEVMDLEKGNIKAAITRRYPRVKHEEKAWEADFIKQHNAPRARYEPDIKNLFYDDIRNLLYVETSTRDKEKGILFDVFDDRGRYLDCFFLKIDGYVITFQDGYVFYGSSDAEGFPFVVKALMEG